MIEPPINLVVLLSGSGTTLQNLLDRIEDRTLNARVSLVIGSRAGLVGLDRAKRANIPTAVVDPRMYANCSEFSRRIFELCREAKPDLICMAGWLCLVEIPPQFLGKVMNIHPALLPSFGGKGMYGRKVHQAVLAHGCKISGCTVHFVDNTYDTGPIIIQRCCPVQESDTAEEVAHRVFEEEKIAYPQAIELFQRGRLRIEGRRVIVSQHADTTSRDTPDVKRLPNV